MEFYELLLIAVGLACDAFAVSVTNGMCVKKHIAINSLLCGICFGLFQGAMPVIGYTLGMSFSNVIERVDHFIALILLGFIGVRMMCDCKNEDEISIEKLGLSILLTQGLATSVDALAVGVSFAVLSENIVISAGIISMVTLIISSAGFVVGRKFGNLLNGKAQFAGGLILLLIGLKIFVEHIFFC